MEPVLEAIRAHLDFVQGRRTTPAPGRIEVLGQSVRITSLRLQTFAAHPPVCVDPQCGCKATHFAVERSAGANGAPAEGRYHLNLYGRDARGQEVLFTHDHALARSLGGGTQPVRGPPRLALAPARSHR